MKILLVLFVVAAVAGARHYESTLAGQQARPTQPSIKALTIANAQSAIAAWPANGKAVVVQTLPRKSVPPVAQDAAVTFEKVKDTWQKQLGCAEDEQIAYTRPTKASFISEGLKRALMAIDQTTLAPADQLDLPAAATVVRVFGHLVEDQKQGLGKMMVALLVLPEESMAVKNTDLEKRGYWVYKALAFVAAQCVDQSGQPHGDALKLADRYLTVTSRGTLELAQDKFGFRLGAEKNTLALKTTDQTSPGRPIFLPSISTPGNEHKPLLDRWIATKAAQDDFTEEFKALKREYTVRHDVRFAEWQVVEKNLKGIRHNQALLNQPKNRSITNRPKSIYYRLAARQYQQQINFFNAQKMERLAVIDEERKLFGEDF